MAKNHLQNSGNIINMTECQQDGEIEHILPNRQLSPFETEQVLHCIKEKIWKE